MRTPRPEMEARLRVAWILVWSLLACGVSGGAEAEPKRDPERLCPDQVPRFPDRGLYDPDVLRTIFLEFSDEDPGEQAGLEEGRSRPAAIPPSKDVRGLHATFQLSGSGESLWLVDRDDRGNAILDRVVSGKSREGASLGRLPDGLGELSPTAPTRGGRNEPPPGATR